MASAALLTMGFIAGGTQDYWALFLLNWCNLTGVFFVYRLNDIIDQNEDLEFNLRHFFSYPIHVFATLQFIILVIPLSILYLNKFVFLTLGCSAILGVVYSITFRIGAYTLRLKHLFLVKNLLIGLVWGALVLIGAGSIASDHVIIVFLFTAIQVFIGGIIRDVPDIEKDRYFKVQSLPVVIGIPNTILLCEIINITFFVACLYVVKDSHLLLFLLIPSIWRFVNLLLLNYQPYNPRWSQTMNLFTCVLIFLSYIFVFRYDLLF